MNIPEMEKDTYSFELSPEVNKLLEDIDSKQNRLQEHHNDPNKEHMWSGIQEKLRMEWVHHSNAIEGSTLSLGDTIFFLQHGITVEGKPFKDFLDARNHAEALDILYEYIHEGRPVTESFIKELNALLLFGVTSTPAIDQFGRKTTKPARPGQYKERPNSVLQPDGTIHYYVEPVQVQSEMEQLCHWVNRNMDKLHPVIVAAIAHYNKVRIHPFDDGNGRGARILMNTILIKKHFPPAIIPIEKRREYIEAIIAADEGHIGKFIGFIAQTLEATLETILNILEGR